MLLSQRSLPTVPHCRRIIEIIVIEIVINGRSLTLLLWNYRLDVIVISRKAFNLVIKILYRLLLDPLTRDHHLNLRPLNIAQVVLRTLHTGDHAHNLANSPDLLLLVSDSLNLKD